MTGTFELTGRILDKSKAPVARARLVLASTTQVLRDPVTNEVYAPPPRVTTDDDGYLCVDLDGNQTPADNPGVDLVVGCQYALRGVNRQLIGTLLFSDTQATAGVLDIADIISEPPAADPSWSDLLAALRDDFDLIAGQTFVESPADSGLFIVTQGGNDRLIPVEGSDGLYVLAADPEAQDHFVTFDTDANTLPQAVEDHIADLAGGGDMLAANNLSELASAPTARTNLGLGTAATAASTAFDTAGAAAAAEAAAIAAATVAAAADATTKANAAQAAAIAASQPLDSDLTAIAALSTTAFGRALLALADAAAGRTALGLGTAATSASSAFQASDAELSAIAGLTSAANKLPYFTGSGTAALADLTAFGRALIDDADAATARGSLGLGTAATADTGTTSGTIPLLSTGGVLPIARLATGTADGTKFVRDDGTLAVPAGGGGGASTLDGLTDVVVTTPATGHTLRYNGTNFVNVLGDTYWQPVDSDLTAIAALTTTSYGRAFLALADAAAGRTALGLGTAATSASGDFQPVDSDLTAIAALTTTTYGRSLLTGADAAATRTTLGLGTAATSASTAFDASGAAAAAQAASQPLDADLTAIAALTTTTYGRSLLTGADAAATRTTLGLGSMATETAGTYTTLDNLDAALAVMEDEIATKLTKASNLSDLTNAATARTNLGLGTAATSASSAFQASDAELTAIAGLVSAADKLPYFTGSGTAALADLTTFGRSLIDDADATAARTTLGLGTAATSASTAFQAADSDLTAIAALTTTTFGRALLTETDAASTRTTLNVQPLDAELTAIAGLTSAADKVPYFTGSGTAALATQTSFARTLLDDPDAATALTTLGAVPTTRTLTAGYGLSGLGDLSANRAPAVGLSYVTTALSVDVSLPAATTTTATTLTLTAGTWLITASATLQASGATTATAEMQVVAGTATVTFDGPRAAGGRTGAANTPISPSIAGCVATVTVGGTVRLDITIGAATAWTAKASTVASTLAGATGMTATRLA